MKVKAGWRSAVVAFALAGLAAPASAADYGIGAAFLNLSNISTAIDVLFPIRTPEWMIEPEVGVNNSKTDGPAGSKTDNYSLGSGLFRYRALAPQFEAYGGARLLYVQSKFDSTPGFANTKSHGWDFAPTVGVQYFFSKQFSLGLDLALHYAESRNTITTSTLGTSTETSSKTTTWSTEGRILVRGYF